MTSEQIENFELRPGGIELQALQLAAWLKEVAYQLAVMNERESANEMIQEVRRS